MKIPPVDEAVYHCVLQDLDIPTATCDRAYDPSVETLAFLYTPFTQHAALIRHAADGSQVFCAHAVSNCYRLPMLAETQAGCKLLILQYLLRHHDLTRQGTVYEITRSIQHDPNLREAPIS